MKARALQDFKILFSIDLEVERFFICATLNFFFFGTSLTSMLVNDFRCPLILRAFQKNLRKDEEKIFLNIFDSKDLKEQLTKNLSK